MPIMDIAALRVFAIVVLMPWLLAASNAAAQDESCRDSFQYDVVVPFQLVCPDSMYAFDPSAVGHSGNLERFCFDRMASRAQANLGSAVVVPTGVSPTNVRMDAPFDRIWIRGNLSRMSCDLWTLGRLNKSYVLTTSSAVEFLDLVTGEVCFAESLTAETTLPVQAKSTDFDVSGLIDAAIAAQVDTTLGGPLATIAANYAPGCVQANVLGRHGDSVVLDRGTRDGVAAGQMFRNEDCVLCVSSAQSGFCLARTTRGDPSLQGYTGVAVQLEKAHRPRRKRNVDGHATGTAQSAPGQSQVHGHRRTRPGVDS
ncbi:MAG: hypothetical protein IPG61_08245 [bacterium]|nr:hypothetical protein [bacterium]